MDGSLHSFAQDLPRQRTLRNPIGCTGVGLHSGLRIALEMQPSPADSGIVFHRSDADVDIPARFDRVADGHLATRLAAIGAPEVGVGTVEHLMAALAALGIDNARISLDGPEVPVLDGSAAPFVFLIDCAGIATQDAPRRQITVLRTIRVAAGDAFVELSPSPAIGLPTGLTPGLTPGLTMELSIAFDAPAIGRQSFSLALTEAGFRRELASARTFITADAIAGLHAQGLAQGGTLDNAVVVEDARVLNPAGLRMPNEFVRHKLLDAIGDLALAGWPIAGRFRAHRSGHALNQRLLEALFAAPDAFRIGPAPALEASLALAAA
ncbi:MAG: UDP-3-O-acyl-N-acetylglucosamine deacetylase [Acetobacteraceae bacterium]